MDLEHSKRICDSRIRDSERERKKWEQFLSDHSRIVFSSSFRRMVNKAQVFPLEQNTSVRNRLTHSLEVADIGRTIARTVGNKLNEKRLCGRLETAYMISIVENACLLHDIGNPPFGHFGEAAITKWFGDNLANANWPIEDEDDIYDFVNFDGNPQGFRIATRLHCERGSSSLNLTASTLLATIKYPHFRKPKEGLFKEKIGMFGSEADVYQTICDNAKHKVGKRYFLAYLMELADDCCYCLSDIADSIEKKVITNKSYFTEIKAICREFGVDPKPLVGSDSSDNDFRFNVAIPLTIAIIEQAANHFVRDIEGFVAGEAKEISKSIELGVYLKCLKAFSRRFIYKSLQIERIELSGYAIVESLLNKFGVLLAMKRDDFAEFVLQKDRFTERGFDVEWRLFNRLSKRMVRAYELSDGFLCANPKKEWIARAHLITDFISGMTDESARDLHNILTGVDGTGTRSAW